jgi:hypothetical protein
LALLSLAALRGAESGWVRAARWLTPLVGGGVAALMITLHFATSAPSTDPLLEQALLVFTWLGGGLALIGITRDAALDDATDGVTTLATSAATTARRWHGRAGSARCGSSLFTLAPDHHRLDRARDRARPLAGHDPPGRLATMGVAALAYVAVSSAPWSSSGGRPWPALAAPAAGSRSRAV